MADEARQLSAPKDDGGNNKDELLFLCCGTFGPGFPPGHRWGYAWFFARWGKFLWRVMIETTARHAVEAKHENHPQCIAGSMIVLEGDPYVELLRFAVNVRSGSDPDREQMLNPFFVFPINERKGEMLHVIVSGPEVTWGDIERTALGIVRLHGGDLSRVRCVWKDRDEMKEMLYWKEEVHRRHIEFLRREPAGEADIVSPTGVAHAAKRRGETPEAARKWLIDEGFAEDEHGNFVRRKPEFDEAPGEGETFALILCRYAKRVGYTGPLYLSAHSWGELFFVAEGGQFVTRFKGKRAWYGYLKDEKRLVCIPVSNRFEVEGYIAYTIPGDPDFLEAMDEVTIARSDEVDKANAALEEKQKKERAAGAKPPDENAGDAKGETKT